MPQVKLRHDPDCPDQSSISEWQTRRGDTMRTCDGCGRWAINLDLEDQANSIDHHDGCHDRDRLRVNLKQERLVCINCGRFVMLNGRSDAQQDEEMQNEPTTILKSVWRCREHLDHPVTWRGRGCVPCDQRASRGSTKRQAAKK